MRPPRAFAFREGLATFTARKERRQRGSTYWTAYRKVRGNLTSAYLGKSPDLTLDRLRAVGARLVADSAYREKARAGGTGPTDTQPPTVPSESRARPAAMVAPIVLPTGTVTFLFTDIEGSTQLWEQHKELMPAALRRHDAILCQAIAAHAGGVFKTIGDSIYATGRAAAAPG